MKSTPFNIYNDLAPIPFTITMCQSARTLKEKGLKWEPHVGCFVWDESKFIEVKSPFPNRIYFILNMGHFLKIFDTVDNMKKQLVWIPTYHQARLLFRQLNISDEIIYSLNLSTIPNSEEEIIKLYNIINEHL